MTGPLAGHGASGGGVFVGGAAAVILPSSVERKTSGSLLDEK
jgi:hypothetical protein